MKKNTQDKLLNIVRKNYAAIAGQYDQTRKKKSNENWQELIDFCSRLKERDSVLDVGCGNGRLLNLVKNKKVDYLGVDASTELITLAKQNYPGYDFQQGNILDLSVLKEKKFDYIFCIAALHHLPGKDLQIQALEQLTGHLRPGGKIFITVWRWNQKKFRRRMLLAAIKRLVNLSDLDFGDLIFSWKNSQGKIVSERYYHFFTSRGLKSIAHAADLQVSRLAHDKYNYYVFLNQ
jgi:2-polyprenyl-3-methyl-5-hydroxy-6-metoxy-1,4-benzoquinol methylase